MKILAVDDDETILELLCLAIQVFGDYEVVGASSGPQALQSIAEADAPFDCFLLDIQMPIMTGIDLCGAIRANAAYTDTPIIMLTAMSDKRYIDAAFSTGATDFIVKPFDMMELKSRLHLAEKQTAANREAAPAPATLASMANSLMQKNPYKISDAMPMLDIDHVLRPEVFENYLAELNRLQYLRTRIFAIHVLDIGTIFTKSSGLEFRDHMTDIAETIQEQLCEAHGLLSYFGSGLYCCVVDAGFEKALVALPAELETAIVKLGMVYRNGAPVEVRFEFGEAVSPNIFTKLSPPEIIQTAVSNLGDGQVTLPAITSAR